MTNLRRALLLLVLAGMGSAEPRAFSQKLESSPAKSKQQILSLDFNNNGQNVTAREGGQIEVTLDSIGGNQYLGAQISSPALRLEDIATAWPPSPAGPRQTYIFVAATAGEAEITITNTDFERSFRVRVKVGKGATGVPSKPRLDQANHATWTQAWTNLMNITQQTFVPTLPRLTRVEVQLVLANPGPSEEEVGLTVLNDREETLGEVSKIVPADDCDRVVFVFPRGGLSVTPGRTYSLRLSNSGNVFGWKYVLGGYTKGQASLNGKPLAPGAHSSFLFATFGTN